MREERRRDDPERQARNRLGAGRYSRSAVEEVTLPAGDDWGAENQHRTRTRAEEEADTAARRDGGPTRTPGMVTTTGGRAGPAGVRRLTRRPGAGVAPTTTGSAGSGGMESPAGGATSDASGQAGRVGHFRDR